MKLPRLNKKVEEPMPDVEEVEEEGEDEIPETTNPPPKEKPTSKEIKDPWSVEQVTTESIQVLYNSETKEKLDLYQAICKILNLLED